jgi:hypothetical protein
MKSDCDKNLLFVNSYLRPEMLNERDVKLPFRERNVIISCITEEKTCFLNIYVG